MAIVTNEQIDSRSVLSRRAWQKVLWLAIALWVVALGYGFFLLLDYENAQGDSGAAPARWPDQAELPAPSLRPTLLIFAHPHCPCTRASFRELEQIVAKSRDALDVRVIFVGSPAERPQLAAATPPLASIHHDDGALAHLFQVKTSGHVLLYSADRQLYFSGGVTAFRGHEGGSLGGAALTACLRTGAGEDATAPVYGCPLFSPLPAAKCSQNSCGDAPEGD